MRIVDLSMTVEECDSAPFAPDESYFKIKPIIKLGGEGFRLQRRGDDGSRGHAHRFAAPFLSRQAVGGAASPRTVDGNGGWCWTCRSGASRERASRARTWNGAEAALAEQGVTIEPGGILLLRTDWPKGHETTDPSWWNDSPFLSREAAQWVVDKQPAVIGYDFAQEEKGSDYQHADEILTSGMTVHRTILPKVTCQIENLINLDQIGASAKIIALPAKWKTESAPARVVALLD